MALMWASCFFVVAFLALSITPAIGLSLDLVRVKRVEVDGEPVPKARGNPFKPHTAGLDDFPPDDQGRLLDWPCKHNDVEKFYRREFWVVQPKCIAQAYSPLMVPGGRDGFGFNGRKYAHCIQDEGLKEEMREQNTRDHPDKVEDHIPSYRCLACIGSLEWRAFNMGCSVCMADWCRADCMKCVNIRRNFLDLCAGALDHHLAVCVKRLESEVQHGYHSGEGHYADDAAYEDGQMDLEDEEEAMPPSTSTVTATSTTATTATTTSLVGAKPNDEDLKHRIWEGLAQGDRKLIKAISNMSSGIE
eukprot:CAMPEP_0197901938 /NCGR_PEP_ID=MMETSP1439-20131203/52251_1 /TAXON_ID=66791 /ORGANISM="Gonyaulax spinifera, Strain CCMP409" /LENGTH=302 /DNA_ID=CAMNT_0043522931 /DNA_START=60 /DNA_END=968 /DNA_ORIENTATION=+